MKYNLGITGHTGVLGSEFIKYNSSRKFIKFRGDITKKKDINEWLRKKKYKLFISFCCSGPYKYCKK